MLISKNVILREEIFSVRPDNLCVCVCVCMYRLHGRVVKGVGHLGNDEAMEAGGREFDPRPGHYSRMSF